MKKIWMMPFVLCLLFESAQADSMNIRAIQIEGAAPYCCTGLKDFPGFTLELVNAMNSVQNIYKFELDIVPSKRFYKELLPKQDFDFVFFQDPKFSFEDNFREVTRFGIRGKEIFFSLSVSFSNEEEFFSDVSIKQKTVAAREGYTYEFAKNTIKDYGAIYRNFRVSLVGSDEQVVDLVLKKRCQMGIVEYNFLRFKTKVDSNSGKSIYIAKRADSPNFRRMIVSKKSRVSSKDLDALFRKLAKEKVIEGLAQKYNIEGIDGL